MRTRYYSLKKPRIRQSWNKFNLYNLSRLQSQYLVRANFFQQKWAAKAITRAYHGEQVREHQWERMFSPHLRSVVSMDHYYLAMKDGSDESAGRGMGVRGQRGPPPKSIPYMNMTFAPLERRLDTAVFRAMFASSIRQARQFVIHGHVRVNGKRMPYAGYMLNPGDMFSVDPERVLFATGRQSDSDINYDEDDIEEVEAFEEKQKDPVEATPTEDASSVSTSDSPEDESTPAELSPESTALIAEVQSLISTTDESTLSAKQKPPYRTLKRISTNLHPTPSADALSSLSTALSAFQHSLASSSSSSSPSSSSDPDPENPTPAPTQTPALDARWKPRPYLAPFAVIPRYLEVNHAVCAAVYLRHPVARAGAAEVPSPFHIESHQLAHNWYLRRR